MEVIAQQHQWIDLKRAATETLDLYPNDADGMRALLVAQTGIDQVTPAEAAVQAPSVDPLSLPLDPPLIRKSKVRRLHSRREGAFRLVGTRRGYANIATAYHTMGKADEAIDALRQEVRINPNLRSATRNLNVELAMRRGRGTSLAD